MIVGIEDDKLIVPKRKVKSMVDVDFTSKTTKKIKILPNDSTDYNLGGFLVRL